MIIRLMSSPNLRTSIVSHSDVRLKENLYVYQDILPIKAEYRFFINKSFLPQPTTVTPPEGLGFSLPKSESSPSPCPTGFLLYQLIQRCACQNPSQLVVLANSESKAALFLPETYDTERISRVVRLYTYTFKILENLAKNMPPNFQILIPLKVMVSFWIRQVFILAKRSTLNLLLTRKR